MRIALDYRSSAPLWRASAPSTCTTKWRSRIHSLEGFSSSHCLSQLEDLTNLGIVEPPINLLVASSRKMNRTKLSNPRLWTSPLVSNSLYRLADVPGFENLADDQIYISSPEFCLLQAAATHSLAQTILYGMEICGTFTPRVGSGDLPKRVQLTSAICKAHSGVYRTSVGKPRLSDRLRGGAVHP